MPPNHPSLDEQDHAVLDALLRARDEVQQWLDLDSEAARYVERHPQTAAHVAGAEASNRKQGKSHATTELVPAFVNFVAKGAKDRGQKGWSATKLRRQLAWVKFLGRDYLQSLVSQPRRRSGLGQHIDDIMLQSNAGAEPRPSLLGSRIRGLTCEVRGGAIKTNRCVSRGIPTRHQLLVTR
jgi:hypothetical protein